MLFLPMGRDERDERNELINSARLTYNNTC